MKIGICGHFGGKKVHLDGQTVKTKIVFEALSSVYGPDSLEIVDTYNIKKRFIPVFFRTVASFIKCDSVIMLPAHNGIRIFAPLFKTLKGIFKKKIYYVVIGGWLPGFLSDKPSFADKLKVFDAVFVETETMKAALCDMGFDNVVVLPNFKKLTILGELQTRYEEPYRLCTFSRVMKEKGIPDAVDAVTMANERLGKCAFSLDIYGQIDTSYSEEFTALQSAFPDFISYKGLVPFDKSTEVLKDYYMLLFPTYYSGEGFAGTLLDAFASALPVAASDWKYNSEIIDDSVGMLFEPQNPEILCNILIDVYNKKYDIAAMKKNCIAKAHHYSFENAAKIICDVIK